MRQLRLISLITSILFFSLNTSAEDFWTQLKNERIVSDSTIIWQQVGPGNAGFANLLRYHPTIPGHITQCPDMWNAYQSKDNGDRWYSVKDYDGNGEFYHLRDLTYSMSDAEVGITIESSQLWHSQDTGRTWTMIPNCPWYNIDATDGSDQYSWYKKVAAVTIHPTQKNTWFVAGGANVRQQDWLSSYMDVNTTNPRGTTNDYEGMLWRTNNAGSDWELINTGLDTAAQIGRIIVNPRKASQVFASSNYGVYRSNDGGNNWTQISNGQLDNDIIMDMDFYYNANEDTFVLYLIDQVHYLPNGSTTTCTGGIYRSNDEGENWIKINGNLALDINRLSGNTSGNYYKYIAKWLNISETEAKSTYTTLPTQALQYYNMISVDPSRQGALYIGFADPQVGNSIVPGRLWTTSDDGEKWISTARLYEEIWEADSVYWNERNNPYHENMVVGHSSPHMQSGNNYALRSMRGLSVSVDGSVMIISDHSTMLSTDHGVSWHQVDEDVTEAGNIIGRGNSNLPGLKIAQDKRTQSTLLGSGEHHLWIPTDDSPDKRQALKFVSSTQQTVATLAYDPYDADIVYSTSNRQANKQNIFRSTDGGYNWSNYGVATPATNTWLDDFYTNALTIDPIDNNIMYHGITRIVDTDKGYDGGFFVSTDKGLTFQQSNEGLPSPARIRDIEFDPRDNDRSSLFAAAEKNSFDYYPPVAGGGLYHSTDRGASWSKVSLPVSRIGVNYIAFDNTDRIYITTGHREGGSGVWYSDDYGENWTQIFDYAGAECIAISPFDNNLIAVTVEFLELNTGVYISRDRGLTWSKSNINLGTNNHIEDIKFDIFDPTNIWLATLGCGFYKGTIKDGEKDKVIEVSPQFIDYQEGGERQITTSIVNSDYANEDIIWKSENPGILTVDDNGYITPLTKGKTKVWAMTADGRFSDYCVVVNHTGEMLSGINEHQGSSIYISPVSIENTFSVNGVEGNATVIVYSLTGQELLRTSQTKHIDISPLNAATYIVKVETEQESFSQKVVKM